MDPVIDIGPELMDEEGAVWELFHVNSKTTRSDLFVPSNRMAATMRQMPLTFSAASRPIVPLPPADVTLLEQRTLAQAMFDRATPQNFVPDPLTLAELATLIFSCAGQNRTSEAAGADRPFRVVPSGGAMYPTELYIHCKAVEGLDPGIYHYDPTAHGLRLHLEGDQTDALSRTLVQPNLPRDTSVQLIFSLIPARLTIKYGERGYRFALLEAGHAAQNAILTARAMGHDAIPVGGYRDEELEALLGLDGVNHVIGYLVMVGRNQDG